MDSYLAIHKDLETRLASRSGGVFTALTDYILENGGVVYGAKINETMDVVYDRAVNKSQRDAFRGSKYVKSKFNNCIELVKEDLRSGKKVLFSGIPCQVAAVKKAVAGINDENFFCVDIVCHGAPNPKIWKKYLEYIERKYKGKVESVDFRNKRSFGWKSHIETYIVKGKEHHCRQFTDLFCEHLLFDHGCFSCKFKALDRVGDITLGDAWGYDLSTTEFNDNKGTSLVLVNSMLGTMLFTQICGKLVYRECKIEDFMQPPLYMQYAIPKRYSDFLKDAEVLNWEELYKKYCPVPFLKRILRQIKYSTR